MNDTSVIGMGRALLALILAAYLLFWFASGCTAWAVNGSAKCHTGYSPVTHLCADLDGYERCSGWSAPGFCWVES